MLQRLASLVLVSSLAIGCTADVAATESEIDELARASWTPVVSPDAGVERVIITSTSLPLGQMMLPPAAVQHDCHDPCPGPCGEDEACCGAIQRCVPLSCPSCCPDPAFGFDAIRRAMADR